MRLAALLALCAMLASAVPGTVYAHPAASAFAASGQERASSQEAPHHVSRLKRYRRWGSRP